MKADMRFPRRQVRRFLEYGRYTRLQLAVALATAALTAQAGRILGRVSARSGAAR